MNPLFGNRKIRFLFTYPFIFIALMIIPFLDIGFREYRDYIVNDHIDKFKSHLQTYLSFEPNTQNISVVRRGNVVIVDVDNRSFHSLFRRGFDILGSKTLRAVVARTPSDVATVVHIRRQYWMLGYYEGGIDIFSRGKDLVSEDNLYNLYQSNNKRLPMFRVDCEVTVIDAYSHGIIGKQIVRGYIPAKTIYSIEKFAERLYFVHTAESGTTNTAHVLFGPDGYPRGIAGSKPNDDQILAAILSIVEFVKE